MRQTSKVKTLQKSIPQSPQLSAQNSKLTLSAKTNITFLMH